MTSMTASKITTHHSPHPNLSTTIPTNANDSTPNTNPKPTTTDLSNGIAINFNWYHAPHINQPHHAIQCPANLPSTKFCPTNSHTPTHHQLPIITSPCISYNTQCDISQHPSHRITQNHLCSCLWPHHPLPPLSSTQSPTAHELKQQLANAKRSLGCWETCISISTNTSLPVQLPATQKINWPEQSHASPKHQIFIHPGPFGRHITYNLYDLMLTLLLQLICRFY